MLQPARVLARPRLKNYQDEGFTKRRSYKRGYSRSKLKTIRKQFQQIYVLNPPYNKYVNCCGISTLRVMADRNKELILREGESLDDLCLDITLRKEAPKDLELPPEYCGVRVFYEVAGEIIAQTGLSQRHIAPPLTSQEIIDILGVSEEDKRVVEKILREIRENYNKKPFKES